MILKSKIIFFLIISLAAGSLLSCKKSKYDVIPDVYVDFTIDLNDIIFRDLDAITNHVIVTYQTNNWGSVAAGYDSNGIIVYRSDIRVDAVHFMHYDRTCPYDYAVKWIKYKSQCCHGDSYAICPRCSTNYSLYGRVLLLQVQEDILLKTIRPGLTDSISMSGIIKKTNTCNVQVCRVHGDLLQYIQPDLLSVLSVLLQVVRGADVQLLHQGI